MPDARKLHKRAIPRLGGVSFFPTVLFAFCFVYAIRILAGYQLPEEYVAHLLPEMLLFGCGMTLLYLTGIADDLVGVRYRQKFVIQILCACFFPLSGLWINDFYGLFGIYELSPYIGMPFTVLTVVFITNAINLIDGIDGLASGLSCISLFVLGLICMVEGDELYALLAFSTFGVIVPFWFYNVFGNAKKGHKLFMGDTGSLILGYIISSLVIHLSRVDSAEVAGHSNMVLAFSTLIVPLFDVVRVVMHRLREKKNPFLPDKNHFHHKLLRTGLRPRAVMVSILFIALFFIVLNWLLANLMGMTGLLITDIVLWTLLQLGINKAIKKNRETQKP